MAFIKTIAAAEAAGEVRDMYARQEQAWGFVPDYAKVFCHRPALMGRWAMMLAEVKRHVDPRRLEIATLAAAHELGHSPCSLAHGHALAGIIGREAMLAVVNDTACDDLTATDRAIVAFARRVAKDASRITEGEVAALREVHGLTDAEIFDIAAVAAARAFFTKLLDAMGCEPDAPFMKLDDEMRRALTVGRPIKCTPPEMLGGEQAA